MTGQVATRQTPSLPSVGDTLDGRFDLRAVIGEGGMGYVFRAYDHHAAREVALKILTPRYLGRPERELRFLREAELGARARHGNLVQYLDAGRLRRERWPFVSMEIIEGKDVASRLTRGPLPTRLAVKVARQIAGAIRALHRGGVVHRDVTSMNILMRGEDAVLIDLSHGGDMSAPQVVVGQPGRLTQPHEVPGTHYFMPREQACAAPAHPAMDVYAFGVTLIHMLTGRAPSGADRQTFIALQREGKLEPPRVDVRIFTTVPAELAELAHECTRAEPQDRPTVDDIVWRLDEMLASLVMPPVDVSSRSPAAMANILPIDAHAIINDERAASDVGIEIQPVANHEPSKPERRPSGPARPVLAVFAVLALIMGTWALWPRPDHTDHNANGGRGQRVLVPPPPALEVVAPADQSGDSAAASGGEVEAEAGAQTAPRAGQEAGSNEEHEPRLPPPSGERKVSPSTKPRVKPNPAETDECVRTREQAARAVAGYDWPKAVSLAGRSQCWRSENARKRILVQGLFYEREWAKCVRAGANSKDAEVNRWVSFCKSYTD